MRGEGEEETCLIPPDGLADLDGGEEDAVRRNNVTFSPEASFNFLLRISSPPLEDTMASSIRRWALRIHSCSGAEVPLSLSPQSTSTLAGRKRASNALSRSLRRSDLRRGASFLPPDVEVPSLWNMMAGGRDETEEDRRSVVEKK